MTERSTNEFITGPSGTFRFYSCGQTRRSDLLTNIYGGKSVRKTLKTLENTRISLMLSRPKYNENNFS